MTDTEAIALRANSATQRHTPTHYRSWTGGSWVDRDWCYVCNKAWPCDAASLAAGVSELLTRVRELEGGLRRIDALPTGHLRRNGCASPRPWTDQRQVHQIARSVLGDTKG